MVDTEIRNLPSQGVYQQKSIVIDSNGGPNQIGPDTGYDAIDRLTYFVDVPEKQLQSKNYTFTQNTFTALTPDSGYDGFSQIVLNIAVPTLDTSDATATAADIASGKTAYVNGVKITGIYNGNFVVPDGMKFQRFNYHNVT